MNTKVINTIKEHNLIEKGNRVLLALSGGSDSICLLHILSELSEKERKIFVRRYYFMEDSAEIAYRFSLKDNYVRTVLSRVRKKLKKYLTEVQ